MSKFYTGIGSRKAPMHVQETMGAISSHLYSLGWTLRSGGAEGADKAFQRGVRVSVDNLTSPYRIYIPWDGFNGIREGQTGVFTPSRLGMFWEQAEKIIQTVHPAADSLSGGALKLHTRNVFQVLGEKLDRPSKFVVYWAPEKDGVVEGGTATAVMLARRHNIPTFNLGIKEDDERITRWLAKISK